MTDERRVEQLRNYLQYVTPGPWKFFDVIRPSKGHRYYGVGREAGQGRGLETLVKVESGNSFDAVFMAEAREIVPYLLALLDEVRREIAVREDTRMSDERLEQIVCAECGDQAAKGLKAERRDLLARLESREAELRKLREKSDLNNPPIDTKSTITEPSR